MSLVTVFGGSGFIGRHLVQRLAASGASVRVAVRDPINASFLKPMGDVGQVTPIYVDVHDESSVASALAGSDAVVNLIGILYERGTQRFDTIHRDAAARIARAAKAAGADRLVHMSALGASETSQSRYAWSKAAGETAVRDAYPNAVILRPSVVFGPPMSKIHLRGSLAFVMALVRREFPVVLPMQVNIVDVRDVAEAHVRALTQGEDAGRYLTVSGDMQFKDISLALRKAHPELKTPTFTLPYPAALVVSIFHKRLSLA